MKRKAIITGASGGIGSAIARTLANEGFELALLYNTSEKKAQELKAELEGFTKVIAIKCDVSKPQEIAAAVERAKAELGFIDTLINNAGISHISLFDTETQESYDKVMDTNFRSVFTFCNLLVKEMISNKFGRIVNVSSVWGQHAASCEVLYAASKSAILGLTRSLNAELAPSGIIVNAVCPGVISTAMNDEFSKEEKEELAGEIPMGRFGRAEEVASVVKMLTARDLYVAGAEIAINGGWK